MIWHKHRAQTCTRTKAGCRCWRGAYSCPAATSADARGGQPGSTSGSSSHRRTPRPPHLWCPPGACCFSAYGTHTCTHASPNIRPVISPAGHIQAAVVIDVHQVRLVYVVHQVLAVPQRVVDIPAHACPSATMFPPSASHVAFALALAKEECCIGGAGSLNTVMRLLNLRAMAEALAGRCSRNGACCAE